MRLRRFVPVAFACVLHPGAAAAQDETGAAAAFAFRYSLKSSAILSRLPDDPALFPDRSSATGFWRVRLEPTVTRGQDVSVEAAFEQRVSVSSSPSSALGAAAVLPSNAPAPYRVRQLDWRFASGPNADWYGELDRAALHVGLAKADLTVGRQAIGWGRGALFGAVDLFAPFTPLEADREWRRGVDAVRGDIRLADRVSLDSVAAFDDTLHGSAFVSRLRGYVGKTDLEVLGGYRAGDLFGGTTASAAVGDVEIHGELALFGTDAVPGSTVFAKARTITKAVAGGSYRVPIGNGVLLYLEYHYSGFGATSPELIVAQLRDPAFQQRYLRGDTQILTRHAIAALGSYECSPELTLSGQWLHSPVDASGVAVPTATWTFSDAWSVQFSGYLPYGRTPEGLTLVSEYGAFPLALFAQLRMYR